MKITALETLYLDEFPHLCWVQVHTDEGLVGLGETYFGPQAVAAHIHANVAPYLLGKDPLQIDRHWRALYGAHGIRSTGVEDRALSATDIALWDVFGQATHLPIYQLLGGATRERIRIYNTVAGYRHTERQARPGKPSHGNWGLGGRSEGPYEDYEAQFERPEELAESLLSEGISAIKLFPFEPPPGGGQSVSREEMEIGLEPFRRIRKAVGNRLDIAVDLGCAYSLPAALKIARALEEFELMWIEDPMTLDDLDALAEFSAAIATPVAGSEFLGSRYAFRELLEKRAVSIVLMDPGWVGGISEGRKVAAMAEAFHRPFAPHECTGPVAMIAGIHLCINATNAFIQETVRAYYRGSYLDIVTRLPRIEGGYAYPPEGPGLGTSLQPELFKRADAHVQRTELS